MPRVGPSVAGGGGGGGPGMAAIFGPGGPIILLQTEYRLQGGPFLRGDHPRCDTTTTATARGASPLPLEVPVRYR